VTTTGGGVTTTRGYISVVVAPAIVRPAWPRVYSGRFAHKCSKGHRGSGQEFTRWVTPEDADEALQRSALLAFEN
jgi:hypothetical protein